MERRSNNILLGVFFIVIGIYYAGNVLGLWEFNMFFKGWWTLIIILPCLFGIFINGFSSGKAIGIIIGIIFLLHEQNIIGLKFISKLIIPIIFIWIGMSVIKNVLYIHKDKNVNLEEIEGATFDANNRENLHFTSIFGGVQRKIRDEKFNKISMFSLFGGIDLDLREACIYKNIRIDTVSLFGGSNIFIPSTAKVKLNGIPIFGGVTDLTRTPMGEYSPTIYIEYMCMFGALNVK